MVLIFGNFVRQGILAEVDFQFAARRTIGTAVRSTATFLALNYADLVAVAASRKVLSGRKDLL